MSLASRVIVVAWAALSVACGPTFKVEPLVGEDPEILTMIGVGSTDMATPETVAAAESFYRELWSKRTQGIWDGLSRDTKLALDAMAQTIQTNGRSMLQSRMFPKAGGGTTRVSLAALFMVRRPTAFKAANTARSDASVTVSNGTGDTRNVQLRRERGTWKVHQTDFSTLPQALDLQPRLLPQDQPKPAPAPAAEEADDDAEEVAADEEAAEPADGEPKPPTAPKPARPDPDLDF